MSRQQRRAAERAAAKRETKKQFFDRVHGEVKQGDTIQDLWRVYYRNRFELQSKRPLEPEHIQLLQEVFYSGVAAMMQLQAKIADNCGDDEAGVDIGAWRIQMLCEELETFTKGLK